MCAKFQLSRLIFIFISCQQLLSAMDSCSAVENYFQQLLTADDRCHEKNVNEIFIFTLKVICVVNFSSLG